MKIKGILTAIILILFANNAIQAQSFRVHLKKGVIMYDASVVDSIVYYPNLLDPELPILGYIGYVDVRPWQIEESERSNIWKTACTTPLQHATTNLYFNKESKVCTILLTENPTEPRIKVLGSLGWSNICPCQGIKQGTNTVIVNGKTYYMWYRDAWISSSTNDFMIYINLPPITFKNAETDEKLYMFVSTPNQDYTDVRSGGYMNKNTTGSTLHIKADAPYEVWTKDESDNMQLYATSSNHPTYGDNHVSIPDGMGYAIRLDF